MHAQNTTPTRGLIRQAAVGLRDLPARAVGTVVRAFPKKPRQPIERIAVPEKPYTGPKAPPTVKVRDGLDHFRRHSMPV